MKTAALYRTFMYEIKLPERFEADDDDRFDALEVAEYLTHEASWPSMLVGDEVESELEVIDITEGRKK